MDQQVYGVSWVDRTLADLSKAAGTPPPAPLRAFGRRILEFPTHYHDLHAKARASHLSQGGVEGQVPQARLGVAVHVPALVQNDGRLVLVVRS